MKGKQFGLQSLVVVAAPTVWNNLFRLLTTWMKNIHDDLSSLDLGIHRARDLAQNRPLCRLMSACCRWIGEVFALGQR